MSLETCMRHWFDNHSLTGLSLFQYSQIRSHRSHWPGHTHLSFSLARPLRSPETQCDPSCVCLTGDCNNHCIVTLVMIIINQSPQLLGVSPLLSSPLCLPGHPGTCSALVLRTHHHHWPYIIRWTPCCHNSDCLSFKSPVTARQFPDTPPHPVCPHLISPIVKLFTTPTREGFYKINSTPLDDLPGCRNSDTLILPQKEFRVASSQQRSKFW